MNKVELWQPRRVHLWRRYRRCIMGTTGLGVILAVLAHLGQPYLGSGVLILLFAAVERRNVVR